MHGNPIVELAHSPDNPNGDLFVRVSEVDAKGQLCNVSDSYRRLSAGQQLPEVVSTKLDTISHHFNTGSRIRVLIASNWFPRYARNFGTHELTLADRQLTPATHAVHFAPSWPMRPHQPTASRTLTATQVSAAASCTGAPMSRAGQRHSAYAGIRVSRNGSARGIPDTTNTVSLCLSRKSSRSARIDPAVHRHAGTPFPPNHLCSELQSRQQLSL